MIAIIFLCSKETNPMMRITVHSDLQGTEDTPLMTSPRTATLRVIWAKRSVCPEVGLHQNAKPEPELQIYAAHLHPEKGGMVVFLGRWGSNGLEDTMNGTTLIVHCENNNPGVIRRLACLQVVVSRMRCERASYRFHACVLCDECILWLNPCAVCISAGSVSS